MRRKVSPDERAPHVTRGLAVDDLGFGASELLEIKVKAEIYRELLKHIQEAGLPQRELGTVLGIHQPDVSHLLNGRISKFSLGKLIKFAGRLNLGAEVRLTKAEPAKVVSSRQNGRRTRAAAA